MSLIANTKDRTYTVIGALVVIAAVVLGYLYFTKSSSDHTIYADFADAQFIVPGNTVHVNGVTEGKVDSLKVDRRNNTAVVKLSLSSSAWPIHTDATAMVRPVTILGEEYVDLSAGTPSTPAMHDGGTIPLSRTSSSTNLQSVLDSVTDPTATALALTVSSLGQGMAGEGINAQDAIRALSPALGNTSALVQLLNSQNKLLDQMIDDVTPVLHSLDTDNGATLNGLLTTTDNLLGATAASSANIGTDLRELPPTLDAATSTFDQLGNLADQATPALASITPLTDNLQSVSQELLNFSDAANPAVTDLQPLLVRAQTLINKASPVVKTLEAEGPTGLQDLNEGQHILHGNVADLNNFFSFIAEWASTTGDFDDTSHFFRFHAQADGCALPIVNPLCQSGTAANPAAKAKAAATKATPAATAKPAATTPSAGPLNGILSQPTKAVQNLLGGLLGGLTGSSSGSTNGSATGLSQSQEQNMLGYLLGGL